MGERRKGQSLVLVVESKEREKGGGQGRSAEEERRERRMNETLKLAKGNRQKGNKVRERE